MGDIEDLPGEGLCVRCPWHQYKVLFKDGSIGERMGRKQRASIYPVVVTEDGDIYLGFDSLSKKYFDIEQHRNSEGFDESVLR
jgi:hypothetical protein